MKCNKCQTDNYEGSKFCIRCGHNLGGVNSVNSNAFAQNSTPIASGHLSGAATDSATAVKSQPINYIATILSSLTRPVTTFKEEILRFAQPKNASILAAIALTITLLLSILSTVFGLVVSRECTGGYVTKQECNIAINFDKLEYQKFENIILYPALRYLVLIVLMAGVFFGTSRIFKDHTTNFFSLLVVTSISLIPRALLGLLATIAGLFSPELATVMQQVAAILLLTVLIVGVNRSTSLENDQKVYYIVLAFVMLALALAFLPWLLGGKIAFLDGISFYNLLGLPALSFSF